MKALITLARIPEGLVKTRLAKELGSKKATQVYKKCLRKIMGEVGKLQDVTIYIYFGGSSKKLEKWFGQNFTLIPTISEKMEENLKVAFTNAFEKGATKVVSVASDVPQLTKELIQQAFKALDKVDVVMGPDNDNGFYLFGIKKFYPGLFNHQYLDRNNMFNEEKQRLISLGLSYIVMPTLIDIDTAKDLREVKSF